MWLSSQSVSYLCASAGFLCLNVPFLAYLVCIVIKCYFWPIKGMPERGEVTWFKMTPNFISTFPIQVFGFTCAQNVSNFNHICDLLLTPEQLFPIYNEVKNNSQKRLNIVIGSSIGGAVITYELVAIIGYLTFGSIVSSANSALSAPSNMVYRLGQILLPCTPPRPCLWLSDSWPS